MSLMSISSSLERVKQSFQFTVTIQYVNGGWTGNERVALCGHPEGILTGVHRFLASPANLPRPHPAPALACGEGSAQVVLPQKPVAPPVPALKIGRASCRERG